MKNRIHSLLRGSTLVSIVLSLPSAAIAQGAPPADPAPAEAADPAAPTPEDIVVTGSRIQSNGFTAPTPTSVVTSAQIASVAPTRVDEALRLIPAFQTTGSGVARAVSGSTVTADLRGIGPQRTLVLLDGRRPRVGHSATSVTALGDVIPFADAMLAGRKPASICTGLVEPGALQTPDPAIPFNAN